MVTFPVVRRLAALLAAIGATAWAAEAGAEVGAGPYPTSQAVAADAQFLEYAPPPPEPGVVCLVDSGVDPNPDTTGALAGSEALDPSWGTGDALAATQHLVEGHPNGHGTEMAMIMAAPENGWGMVGIAPTSVRVYSIRVVPPGQTTFPLPAYSSALTQCLKLRGTTQPTMTVVNLSIGGTTTPSTADIAQIGESVEAARQHGLDVVAAAGNRGSVAVEFPAAYPPVIAVGAGDAAAASVGVICGFSNGSGLDALAPGCDSATGGVDEAFQDDGTPAYGFGTSQSAAIASAVLAAMRAYAPTLNVEQAEDCLTSSEVNGGNLDAAAAFAACGLYRIVAAGLAATPPLPSPATGQNAPSTTMAPVPNASSGSNPTHRPALLPSKAALPLLPRPRVASLRIRHGSLTIRVLNRPRGVFIGVKMRLSRRDQSVSVERRSAADTMTFQVRAAYAVAVRFVSQGPVPRRSAWVTRVIA